MRVLYILEGQVIMTTVEHFRVMTVMHLWAAHPCTCMQHLFMRLILIKNRFLVPQIRLNKEAENGAISAAVLATSPSNKLCLIIFSIYEQEI